MPLCSTTRRPWVFVGLVAVTAVAATAATPAGAQRPAPGGRPAPAASAVVPLPDVALRVDWRVQPVSAAGDADTRAGFSLSTARGGPARSTTAPGSWQVTTQPRAGGAGPVPEGVWQLRLRNGGQAAWGRQQWQSLPTGEWLVAPATAASAPARGGAIGQQRQWVPQQQGLRVSARWPGGEAPVAVQLWAGTGQGVELATDISLPLDTWVAVARGGDQVMWVRVSVVP
jgi:hypothetical protein